MASRTRVASAMDISVVDFVLLLILAAILFAPLVWLVLDLTRR